MAENEIFFTQNIFNKIEKEKIKIERNAFD